MSLIMKWQQDCIFTLLLLRARASSSTRALEVHPSQQPCRFQALPSPAVHIRPHPSQPPLVSSTRASSAQLSSPPGGLHSSRPTDQSIATTALAVGRPDRSPHPRAMHASRGNKGGSVGGSRLAAGYRTTGCDAAPTTLPTSAGERPPSAMPRSPA